MAAEDARHTHCPLIQIDDFEGTAVINFRILEQVFLETL